MGMEGIMREKKNMRSEITDKARQGRTIGRLTEMGRDKVRGGGKEAKTWKV